MKKQLLAVALFYLVLQVVSAKPSGEAEQAPAKTKRAVKRFNDLDDGFGNPGMMDWKSLYAKRAMARKRQLENFEDGFGGRLNDLPMQDWQNTYGRDYRSFGKPNALSAFGHGATDFKDGLQNWQAMYQKRLLRAAKRPAKH